MDKGKLSEIKVGECSEKGVRPTMEDAHLVITDLNKQYKIKGEQMALFGVFDGHGGSDAANVAKEIFADILVKDKDFKGQNYEKALYNAFLKTDQEILSRCEKEQWTNGCTACVVLVVGKRLYTANLGDAEAVVAVVADKKSKAKPMPLSTKHNPTDESEKTRIEQAGGQVVYGRINGTLGISRSFGDYLYKYPYNKALKDWVSALPALKMTPIGKGNPFMIITCDGLYEAFDYDSIISFTEEKIAQHKVKNLEQVAKDVVAEALKKGSQDNCTCLVIHFKWK